VAASHILRLSTFERGFQYWNSGIDVGSRFAQGSRHFGIGRARGKSATMYGFAAQVLDGFSHVHFELPLSVSLVATGFSHACHSLLERNCQKSVWLVKRIDN
jgi:hypothetical protein